VRKIFVVSLLILLSSSLSCSYRLAGKRVNGGEGKTIAVPTFVNRTTTYRVEQRITDALRQELIKRTQYRVVPQESGDVVVAGEVLNFVAVPVIFNEQGRGSSYSIIIDMSVRLTDSSTGAVLFQNDYWTFRDIFELAQNSNDFVPEDTAAVDRLARRFASSLVASLLNAKP